MAVPGYWKPTLRLNESISICCTINKYQNIHLEQTLFLGLDTLKERGVGELELVVFSGFESVVRLGLGNLLHELLKVTAVSAELEAVQVKDIGDSVVKEGRVVRDDDYKDAYKHGMIGETTNIYVLDVHVLRLVR